MFHRPKTEEDSPNEKKEGPNMSAQTPEAKPAETTGAARSSIEIPPTGLNRMGQGAPRIPGSYPGYAAANPYNPADPSSGPATVDNGRKLIVGRGISMSGEIESCDHLIVEGKVEAALKGANMLDIAESGTFFGTVEIEEAVVAGRFEGDLTVNGRLTIRSGGSITGAISYGELAVEAGAILDGKLSPLKSSLKSGKPPVKKTDASVMSGVRSAADVQGGELPFSEKAVAAAE